MRTDADTLCGMNVESAVLDGRECARGGGEGGGDGCGSGRIIKLCLGKRSSTNTNMQHGIGF